MVVVVVVVVMVNLVMSPTQPKFTVTVTTLISPKLLTYS
jgi:hypothetical protein